MLDKYNSRTTTAPGGQRRAPLWRKTRAEVVDEKVEKLFEAYKAIDAKNEEMAKNGLLEAEDPAKKLRRNYFPDDSD